VQFEANSHNMPWSQCPNK